MKKFRTGLVVGKFCPLHRGHEFVIETALEQCDEVIILSYTSENFGYNYKAETRESWLKQLYSRQPVRIHVLDAHPQLPIDLATDLEHRSFCAEYLLYDLETTVQAVFSSENYGDGFAEFLTTYFSDSLKEPTYVEHVMVDAARERFSTSGTALRKSLDELYISPWVRRDLVPRILFTGAESSGKTTLVQHLSKELDVAYTREYGRVVYEARIKEGKILAYEDFAEIARIQEVRERTAAFDARMLLCDTSAVTTEFYAEVEYGQVARSLRERAWKSMDRYDLIFFCNSDIPHEQDGTRRDEAFRSRMNDALLNKFLPYQSGRFFRLSGTLEERAATAKDIMNQKGYI
jgi:HTH-type transcriptional repressor of NAD biosynthesis genes